MRNQQRTTTDFRCHSVGKNTENGALLCQKTLKESFKLLYVYEGVCTIDIEGMVFRLQKGYSALVYPLCRFQIRSEADVQYAWIEFSGFAAESFLNRTAFSRANPVIGPIELDGFEKHFDIPLFNGETYTLYRQGGCFMLLISYYIEHFPGKTVETGGYVFRACQYIDQHFSTQGFGVKEVAGALKIDRSYLYRLFAEELGMSVMEYITNRRLSKASVLLANSNLSVKDIAYSVGYADQMYFSRVFKQCNGQTPTAYRQGLFNGSDIPTKP